MIYILHGDDITASRLEISKLLSGISFVTRLNAEKASDTELIQSLKSQDLFVETKAVVFENFQKLSDGVVSEIYENKDSLSILLWTDQAVSPKMLQKYKGAKVLEFLLPKHFYAFLDELMPQNASRLEKITKQLTSHVAPEQVFYAMVKRIRVLMIVKLNSIQNFADTRNMSSWQLSKLQKQASRWNIGKIVSFYKKLFEVEVAIKTSTLPLPLGHYLDILLLSELK